MKSQTWEAFKDFFKKLHMQEHKLLPTFPTNLFSDYYGNATQSQVVILLSSDQFSSSFEVKQDFSSLTSYQEKKHVWQMMQ